MYLYVYLSEYLSICQIVRARLDECESVGLDLILSVCGSIAVSQTIYLCQSISTLICLHVNLYVCLSVCPLVESSVCPNL